MLTWDECYRQGLSKREAAFEMNCDAKTASRALKMAGERVREYAAMNAARNARDLHRIAHAETRPKSERSSYPVPLLEISDLNLGVTRSPVGPLTDTMRNKAAQGIPFAEITPNYGNERHPKDSLSRAQSEFDATERYREAWSRIDAREAAAGTP
ncbi:MAG TPA: hypothetical protein VN519_06660 [Bryobacteraceae bacterium]|nr:hypothetical protein [Bryobacteraceae bacterium]